MQRLREVVGTREVFFVSLGLEGPLPPLASSLASEFRLRRVFPEPGRILSGPSIHVHRLEAQRRH